MSHVMNTYARLPVAFVRGQGVWLWDQSGRKYLDALAGNLIFEVNRLHANGRPGTPLTDTRGDLPVLAADQTRAFNDPANT